LRLPPRSAPLLALALLLTLPSLAEPQAFDFYARGPYRSGIPRPEEVLGYAPGTFHTGYGNMERYVRELVQRVQDRAVLEPYGRTYEARERLLLIVTSIRNLNRLDAIRAASARLADPRGLSTAEADRLIQETPATVWLNYSIHGDESASFEAMAQVAYQLAAGEDSTTRAIREHCVVILNLAHNPDGHERFVTWVNALGQGNPDPLAIEQDRQQPWGIRGRTNHYQIDLNRDALAMSQAESQQMAQAFRRWNPQVFVDHHGQTESYFFAPPAAPINPQLGSAEIARWTEIFGRANAEAFDRFGWNYYVRDVFDLYYPGYWDSWPSLHGAVGMTYETDGGGNLAVRRDDETVVTLLDGIQRHFVASLATCATAANHRRERLRDFHRFALEAIDEGRRGPVRAYALEPGDDPVRAAALAEVLMRHGVEVRWHPGPLRAGSARPVWWDPAGGDRASAEAAAAEAKVTPRDRSSPRKGRGSESERGSGDRPPAALAAPASADPRGGMLEPPRAAPRDHTFSSGAWVVDLAQPCGRLARTLMEPGAPVDDAFASTQLDKYRRNRTRGRRAPREGYDFYDVTEWSLPLAYGVTAFALPDVPAGTTVLGPPDALEASATGWEDTIPDSVAIGVPFTARQSAVGPLQFADAQGRVVVDLHGRVEGGVASTAYVWSCAPEGATRLALRLMQEEFRVATTTRPLRAGGRDFPRGSFLARVERNGPDLHARVAWLARTSGVTVQAVNSAWADRGDTGVGSESIESLRRPSLAVLVDGPVSTTEYGSLWFVFERRLGLRFTALRVGDVARADLSRYNVLVIPDGSASALAGALGEGGIKKLQSWVQEGGTLVCLENAALLPTLKTVKLSTAWPIGVPRKEKTDEDAPPDTAETETSRRPEPLPGTVFWARVDDRHFLGYGYERSRLPVLLEGRDFLQPSREGANPLVLDGRPLAYAGWVWPETERRLRGAAFAVDEPVGQGHVVMFTGAPGFRLFWRSTERMLLNAIVYGPTLD
jgi:hypothetical protein